MFGAYHGSEVGFVFDVKQELHGSELDLAERMATYWTGFAATADPNPAAAAEDAQSSSTPSFASPSFHKEAGAEVGGGGGSVCLNGGAKTHIFCAILY